MVTKMHGVPNFIYIGTGKAGTTWLFQVLQAHPQIFVTPVKETNFFDLNFGRGLEWYRTFFKDASGQTAIGEISHRYIHCPDAARRIRETLGEVKLIVGLREPIDYCVSDFLFTVRNGRFAGDLRQWCREGFDWSTVRYKDMLEPFLKEYPVERIHVYNFDLVAHAPDRLISNICRFLDVDEIPLRHEVVGKVNAAARARVPAIAGLVNRTSKFLKRRGGQRIIAFVKRQAIVQRALFRQIDQSDRPNMPADLKAEMRAYARPHLEWLDQTFETSFVRDWNGR